MASSGLGFSANIFSYNLKFLLIFGVVSAISGELIITHAPEHVRFLNDAGQIAVSEVSKAVSLAMGFLPKKDITWNGLAEGNPFKRPRANVLIAVESSLKLSPKHVLSYPLENDAPLINMDSLALAVQDLFLEKEPLVVDLASDNTMFDLKSRHESLFRHIPVTVEQAVDAIRLGSALAQLSPGSLNVTQLDHRNLLAEIHVIFKIIESIRAHPEIVGDGVPDLYSFGISGLAHIVDTYGTRSQEAKDAVALVERAVDQVTAEFRRLYGDNVIVELVRMGPADRLSVRKARSLMAATDAPVTPVSPTSSPDDGDKYNLAPVYTEMYPIVFNIILWTMVVLALTVFAVSLGLWHMDPGRDSIIYRMTSHRMKKD